METIWQAYNRMEKYLNEIQAKAAAQEQEYGFADPELEEEIAQLETILSAMEVA